MRRYKLNRDNRIINELERPVHIQEVVDRANLSFVFEKALRKIAIMSIDKDDSILDIAQEALLNL